MDIVERLRKESYWALSGEAADEIERLREQLKYSNEFREIMNEERCDALEENERLRNGLEHIVEIYDHHVKTYDHVPSNVYLMAKIARDALKEKE